MLHTEQFTAHLRAGGRSEATVEKYVREVRRFDRWLGDREVSAPLVQDYRQALAGERSAAGVNGAVAALNALFDFLGLPECRLKALRVQRRIFRDESRVLSGAEYRRLLAAAKGRGNERLLLVMETICATGIRVSELRFFTVEAVRAGRAEVCNKGKSRTVFLPGKLQKVLLKYVKAQKIAAGPVFVTRTGRPLDRRKIWWRSCARPPMWRRARCFPIICGICLQGRTTGWRRILSGWQIFWGTAVSIPRGFIPWSPGGHIGGSWRGCSW